MPIADQVKNKVRDMRRELLAREKQIQQLEDELFNVRGKEEKQKQKMIELESHMRKDSKLEMEHAVGRHLRTIEQLIKEKEKLNTKCSELTKEVKQVEEKHERTVKQLTEQHEQEVKRQQDVWLATEKVKRQSWMNRIKEDVKRETVQGLEPEVQRLLMQFKHEKRQLQEQNDNKLMEMKNELNKEHEKHCTLIRDKLYADMQVIHEREKKELLQQLGDQKIQYQKQMDQVEQEHSQRIGQQKQEYQAKLAEQIAEHQARIESLKMQGSELNSAQKRDAKNDLTQLEKQHAEEMRNLKFKWDIEREQWQTMMIRKQEEDVRLAKRQLAMEMNKQLDDQINALVAQLRDDLVNEKRTWSQESSQLIYKLKSQHASELERWEQEVNQWKDKYVQQVKQGNKWEQDCKQRTQQLSDTEEQLVMLRETQRLDVSKSKSEIVRLENQIVQLEHCIQEEQLATKQSALQFTQERNQWELMQREREMSWESEREGLKQDAKLKEDEYRKEMERLIATSQQYMERKDAKVKELQEKLKQTEVLLTQGFLE